MDVLQKFAQRLLKLHNENGLSQDDAVVMIRQKTGEVIHQTTYSNWLRGKKEPTISNLAALARAYGVSADYLAGLSDDPTPSEELSHDLQEAQLPEHVEDAAKKLTCLSEVSQDRIIAEIEERYRSEQRWQQIESLVKKMDTDGSVSARLLSKLDDLGGSLVAQDSGRELVG